jgi:anti-anti-sigma factor
MESDMADFVQAERPDGRPTLVASGEVDIAVVDDLLAAARTTLDRASDVLEVDLAGVTFIDSSGLGALVQIRNLAAERDLRVSLARVPRSVQRIIDLTGLDSIFSGDPDA